MKNGWCWEIDHLEKTSCGYVFSSKHCSDNDAIKEVSEKFEIELENPKIINFKTGRKEKHWIGNLISLGNSDFFIEPLESTGLMTITVLSIVVTDIIRYGNNCGSLREQYDEYANNYYDTLKDFVLFHFCFNRKKVSKYWNDYSKNFKYITKGGIAEQFLNHYLKNDVHLKFLSHLFNDNNPFGVEGWFSIFRGLDPKKSKIT